MKVTWKPTESPLAPAGAWASGLVAQALARRLLAFDDPHLGKLSGLTAATVHPLLIVLGDELLLPWIEGIRYLGRDDRAPSLLLPTSLTPNVPLPLLERALLHRASDRKPEPPLIVIPDPPSICWAGRAMHLSREALSARFLSSGSTK